MNRRTRQVTLRDIAAAANVSVATVSRTLNAPETVARRTRNQILRVIENLGYVPNVVARNLKRQETNTVGLILPDIGNPFFAAVAKGVLSALRRFDLHLLVFPSENNAKEESVALNVLLQQRVRGVLIAPSGDNPRLLQEIETSGLPIVILDNTLPSMGDMPHIVADNEGGAYMAARYLLDLGHQEIGIVAGPENQSSARERLAGVQRALRERGVAIDPSSVRYGDYSRDDGFDGMSALLQQTPWPTAVFVANNMMALGAIDATRRRGLAIPDDISVVTFDDLDVASLISPSLTAVRQPDLEMGVRAAEMLLAQLGLMPDRVVQLGRVVLAVQLIVRESCRSVWPSTKSSSPPVLAAESKWLAPRGE